MSFENLKQIKIFRVGNNKLEGNIPAGIWDSAALEILDVGENELHGSIPDIISFAENLQILRLHGNEFVGELPSGMANLRLLQELMLHDNLFFGTIPPWITAFQQLFTLDLSKNSFNGPVPVYLSVLTHLRSLVLSDNQFTGELDETLGNLEKLKYFLINDNNMEGPVPDWSRTSQKLYDLEMLFLTENMWACPPANYSNWTTYTDMSDREEPCACLLSSWSEWSECHESFGPGSVTVQTRTRTILQEAQNGGRCPDLEEYRDCKIHPARILFNGSIPVKELCIGAGITDVVTEVDLFEWYTGDIEIENIVINYTNGAINCNRDQEW
eukprot:CAMPEP_0114649258 /NCGR_PEP_ID=MMETSP0191-20121206/6935_1 /TAXON_ID=126664 /ORGANISM="Sorites sp." /LENGTH=326 /DNA_ID=CAMNT_0001862835 /DNA_START=1320 /DNA_END=2297 /DNA_ORIENTATION=-